MNIFSSPVFGIIISMVLIYALLSILVSILNEYLSHYFEERGKMLHSSILKLLNDTYNVRYGELFYNHSNIQAITKLQPRKIFFRLVRRKKATPEKKQPSYISSGLFADTVIDIISSQTRHLQEVTLRKDEDDNVVYDENGNKIFDAVPAVIPDDLMGRFALGLKSMNPSEFRDTLQGFYDRAKGDYAGTRALMETWFNEYQDRVSGWYKAKQRRHSFWLGLAVAVLLNVDSLHLIKVLSIDDELRNELVEMSDKVSDHYSDLSEKQRDSIPFLIATFSKEDPAIGKTIDSIYRKDTLLMKEKPQLLTDVLMKKNPAKYARWKQMLIDDDSLADAYQRKADEVLIIAADLNIPIGYRENAAPMSWCKKTKVIPVIKPKDDKNGLIAYNEARNRGGASAVLMYLFGIVISAFSLGAGAPFWFNVLVKLVDIRRAGIKPVTEEKNKK